VVLKKEKNELKKDAELKKLRGSDFCPTKMVRIYKVIY
jgi:hypothetical protein